MTRTVMRLTLVAGLCLAVIDMALTGLGVGTGSAVTAGGTLVRAALRVIHFSAWLLLAASVTLGVWRALVRHN